ncbi:MAG: AAA family ATPase, partial [Acidimicrobiia bacterium]|nr:AAA family ATPase [Acidimicrobiia bacterium]
SWLVTGATAAGTRPVRWDVPFIGRHSERAILDAAVDLVRAGHSGVVSIVGEAGSGKTRLADEVVERVTGEAIVLSTACAPYGEPSVWTPVVTALTNLFDIDPEGPSEQARLAVEARADELWGLSPGAPEMERFLSAIAYLLGHPSDLDRLDAAGARDVVAGAIADMMRRHAQTRMTVLWVDNLQWAEPMLRDLLAVVVRSLADLPFLLVTAQRPDDDLVWPPPLLDRPLLLRVPLGPLGRSDAVALVQAIAERDEPDATLSDEACAGLVDRGGGNPLFLVELAAMAAQCADAAELPGTLRALIAARLDQLPTPLRAIVDNAAVLGASDYVDALDAFATGMGQDFQPADLDELVSLGLLEVEGRWWRFRSDVVREVAYQTLTKRVRAQRHAGTAKFLGTKRPHQVEELAHHAAAAAELVAELGRVEGVPSDITERAVDALLAAARGALETGRFDDANRLVGRGLDLHPTSATTERELLLVRSSSELDQRDTASARADADRVLEGAMTDADLVHEGEARIRLGTVGRMEGNLDVGRVELDRAVELFRELGDRPRLAQALRARGFSEVFGGTLSVAKEYIDQALVMFKELDDERGHAWAHHDLAWVAFMTGDFTDAELQMEDAAQRFEALGDRVGVHWAQGLKAFVLYFQRRFDEAEELATVLEAEARRWGDTWARLMMVSLLSNLRLWTGRVAEAEQFGERALAGFREIGDRFGMTQALASLNRARAALGKVAEVRRGAEEAIALGRTFGELVLGWQGAAGVAMHLGDAEQALNLIDQVLERHRAAGSSDAEATVVRALALCQLQRAEEAMEAIVAIDVDDFPFARSARALVMAMAGDPIDAVTDAEIVEKERGASYFDIAIARLAGVVAATRSGDEAGRQQWAERFAALASTVGDVVLVTIAQAIAEPDTDRAEPALATGWLRILDT